MNEPLYFRFPLVALALAALAGCPARPAPPAVSESVTVTPVLRVMVVDDRPLGAAVAREWLAHWERRIELVEVTSAKAATAEQLPVDVVIYPPALVGQFASRDLILPLDEESLSEPGYAREEIFPLLKSQETIWGRRTIAVPLGSPQLALWYRADLLAKENLQPPRTWQEYAAVAARFTNKPADASEHVDNWQATAEPLAAGWAGRLLLARAAASAVQRDQLSPLWNLETLEPLIANPPWVRALEELAAANESLDASQRLSPIECFEKLQAGECALAIGWPGNASGEPKNALQPEQIGVALLPGSRDVYQPSTGEWQPVSDGESLHVPLLGASGRVASVTRASAEAKAAKQFVLWLSGPAVSGRLGPSSNATTVFRLSHFRTGGGWQASPTLKPHLIAYGELLAALDEPPRRLSAPRIPGEHEYLAALEAAVLAVLGGEQPAEEALRAAAEKWQAISKSRGITLQQRMLRRSLGLAD